jgi:hypothetical protein
MMATFTEAQIRAALETIIKAAAPNAVVYPWWVLGHDQNMWPGLLRPSSGPDANKVHGYVITRTQTDGKRENQQCVERQFSYTVWGFHFYETGDRTANSDLAFNAELDAIADSFIVVSSLPPELRWIDSEPSFRVDLDVFGAQLLHYAVGQLQVTQL